MGMIKYSNDVETLEKVAYCKKCGKQFKYDNKLEQSPQLCENCRKNK